MNFLLCLARLVLANIARALVVIVGIMPMAIFVLVFLSPMFFWEEIVRLGKFIVGIYREAQRQSRKST